MQINGNFDVSVRTGTQNCFDLSFNCIILSEIENWILDENLFGATALNK